jgi:hypothetical protein
MAVWLEQEVETLLEKYPEYAAASLPVYLLTKELPGRSPDAIEKKARVLRSQGLLKLYADYAPSEAEEDLERLDQVQLTVSGEETVLESPKGKRIKTLKDLFQAAEVDLDKYFLERHLINKWEVGAKDASGNIIVEPLFQVKAWLKTRKDVLALSDLRDHLIREIVDLAPKHEAIPRDPHNILRLLEIGIFDLHLGRLAWGKETGGDWDVPLAIQAFQWAIDDLIKKAEIYNFERILFPIGQDFFSFDNEKGTTSAGTPQDTDTRWQKMFTTGFDLLRWAVDYMAIYAPVDVVVIPGNHDKELAFCLGALLEAWYKDAPEVDVDNTPRMRKYYQYGKNMLCLTHGRSEKHDVLPGLMAAEAPQMWADTLFREAHVGDLHQRRAAKYLPFREFEGVGVRILPSLAEPDAWHFERGFSNKLRAAEAYVWDFERGLDAILLANKPF